MPARTVLLLRRTCEAVFLVLHNGWATSPVQLLALGASARGAQQQRKTKVQDSQHCKPGCKHEAPTQLLNARTQQAPCEWVGVPSVHRVGKHGKADDCNTRALGPTTVRPFALLHSKRV